jgi:hypothetical protein
MAVAIGLHQVDVLTAEGNVRARCTTDMAMAAQRAKRHSAQRAGGRDYREVEKITARGMPKNNVPLQACVAQKNAKASLWPIPAGLRRQAPMKNNPVLRVLCMSCVRLGPQNRRFAKDAAAP